MVKAIVAVVLGVLVVAGLLFLMQALIASGEAAITEIKTTRIVDFVRVSREERLESKREKPDRPPNPDEAPPEAPRPSMADASGDAAATAIRAVGAAVDTGPVGVAGVGVSVGPAFGVLAGSADGDYLPIVKVAPVYPQRAIDREIEGYVIVEFTVTKTGSVKNPRVLEYYPSPIFNDAAIAAALKFKYKPRIVNGEAIEVKGVLNKITFVLED